MSWVIKVLLRDYTKTQKTWNGSTFVDTALGVGDFMINDFKFSESTWREVSYSPIEQEDLVNRISTAATVTMTSESKRYQFIEPLAEEVNLILPAIPRFNERYIIKNLSETDNKILVRETLAGPVIFTLDSLDEYATLFHDGIEFHIAL